MSQELRELAPLYALGLTDPDEGDALLAGATDDILSEIESFREVNGKLAALTVRNPPSSVKTRLMERLAQPKANQVLPEGVLAMVRAGEGDFKPTPFPGISLKPLFADPSSGYQFLLVRMAAGSTYPSHHHEGIEHTYVLEGDAIFSDRGTARFHSARTPNHSLEAHPLYDK